MRSVSILWLGLCVLTAGAAFGQDVDFDLEFPRAWSGEERVPVADALRAGALTMQAASVRSKLGAKALLDFYRRHFERQGWVVVPLPKRVSGRAVYALEPRRQLQKLVWVEPRGDESEAFLAISPRLEAQEESPVPLRALPLELPEGCAETAATGALDGRRVTTVRVVTCQGSQPPVKPRSHEGLVAAGFRPGPQEEGGAERWYKSGEAWEVRSVRSGGRAAFVFIHSQELLRGAGESR